MTRKARGWLRTVLILVSTGASLVLVLVVDLVNVGLTVPFGALAIAPHVGGRMKARMAEDSIELGAADKGRRARGEALAMAAIVDDPANVTAVRTLALTAATREQQTRSLRLLRYAERLSRRDLPTELALIEVAVQAGDVGHALRHYDRALRVVPNSADILFPVLDQAAARPEIAAPLGRLLREHPAWRPWFLSRMAGDPAASTAALVDLLGRIDFDPRHEEDRQVLQRSLARLVHDRQYGLAFQLYRRMVPSPDVLLRDGGFEHEALWPPFDWILSDTAASREPIAAAGGYALHLLTGNDQASEAARQLLVLPPASYQLVLTYGDVDVGESTARPSVAITCADMAAPIVRIALPSAGHPTRISANFSIPAQGCPAQWLVVTSGISPDMTATTPWITHLSLTPR